MEKVVQFGPQNMFTGILSLPNGPVTDSERPALIVVNTGVIHRVGANRIYPPLVRDLADLGFITLRFDLSGLGDSDVRPGTLSPLELCQADVGDALDFVTRETGAKRFVMIGLCSGANVAIVYAGMDSRVVGTVLMDPTIPQTARFHREKYKHAFKLLFSADVLTLPDRISRYMASRTGFRDPTQESNLELSQEKVLQFFGQAYRSCVERRVQSLAVFTAGMQIYHNYREQILDAFPDIPFGNLIQLEYFDKSDHTFSRESDRLRLYALIKTWLTTTSFSDAAPAKAPALQTAA